MASAAAMAGCIRNDYVDLAATKTLIDLNQVLCKLGAIEKNLDGAAYEEMAD